MTSTRPIGGLKYEVALRAIGQDLSGLLIESLEIAAEGNAFIARASCISTAGRPKSRGSKGIRQLWQRLASVAAWKRARNQRSVDRFERRYTKEEIQVLDMLGSARKTGLVKTPDASSRAESLRTVGRVVDAKKGRLVKVSKDERKITFTYRDEEGRVQQEDFYSLAIYKTQQEALSLRKKKSDVWEGTR